MFDLRMPSITQIIQNSWPAQQRVRLRLQRFAWWLWHEESHPYVVLHSSNWNEQTFLEQKIKNVLVKHYSYSAKIAEKSPTKKDGNSRRRAVSDL